MLEKRAKTETPSIATCRFAVLPIANQGYDGSDGYVVYDRQSGRIVDGAYINRKDALDCARGYNSGDRPVHDMMPNISWALLYPEPYKWGES